VQEAWRWIVAARDAGYRVAPLPPPGYTVAPPLPPGYTAAVTPSTVVVPVPPQPSRNGGQTYEAVTIDGTPCSPLPTWSTAPAVQGCGGVVHRDARDQHDRFHARLSAPHGCDQPVVPAAGCGPSLRTGRPGRIRTTRPSERGRTEERDGHGLSSVGLPAALAVIMFGLGLTLTVEDFRRTGRQPRAVGVALAAQVLLLPAICLGLVAALGLDPLLAVGMMLLAASPGGTTANLFSHLFRGDVALNITLTAINSVLAVLTLPLVVNLAVAVFDPPAAAGSVGLELGKTAQVFAVVLIPVAIGMVVRRVAPGSPRAPRTRCGCCPRWCWWP
jgi:hypothetical protein